MAPNVDIPNLSPFAVFYALSANTDISGRFHGLRLQVNSEDADTRQPVQSPLDFDIDEIINNARGDYS